MDFPVNRPILLKSTSAVLTQVRITAVPQPGLFYGPGGISQVLTLNDVATFAGAASGNVIWTAPVTALSVGQLVSIPDTTTNGLVVSSVPPGVACLVTYQ